MSEQLDEISSSTLSWITERYGSVAFNEAADGFAASVPCRDGIATGKGRTRGDAIAGLYRELTAGLDMAYEQRTHWDGCAKVHPECARSDLARKVLAEIESRKIEVGNAELGVFTDGRQYELQAVIANIKGLFTREDVTSGDEK